AHRDAADLVHPLDGIDVVPEPPSERLGHGERRVGHAGEYPSVVRPDRPAAVGRGPVGKHRIGHRGALPHTEASWREPGPATRTARFTADTMALSEAETV